MKILLIKNSRPMLKQIKKQISLLAITSLLAGLFVAPVMVGAQNSAGNEEQNSKRYEPTRTVQIQEEINLTKSNSTYTSVESAADFDFSSIALSWEEQASNNAHIDLEMRFNNGQWSRWYELEASIDYKDGESDKRKNAFMVTGDAYAYQYKFTLETDEAWAEGNVKNLKVTYFNAAEGQSINNNYYINPPRSANDLFLAFTGDFDLVVSTTSTNKRIGNLNITTRSQWGADESLRVAAAKPKDDTVDEEKEEATVVESKFANELKIVRTVTKNAAGQDLTWPLEYASDTKKIVIHHTATTEDAIVASASSAGSRPNYGKVVRDIYRYHTLTRGWGDIGYHYLIDPNGQVYEGRYGEAIGAHAAGYNTGSLGIAIIGNYQDKEVPDKVMQSLTQLMAAKTQQYKIDADGKTSFRGEIDHNILGHKDLSATVCPGENLYSELPKIRRLVASANSNTRSNAAFEFDNVTDFYALDLKLKETKTIAIKMKNIGRSTWGADSYLALDESSMNKALFDFPAKQGIKLAVMRESSVAPGNTGTFTFTIRSKGLSGLSELALTPFIRASNRSNKINHQIYLPAFVEEPVYKYEVVNQSPPPSIIKIGQLVSGYVDLKNTGNTTWSKTDPAIVLGTDRPRDRLSAFVRQKPFTRLGGLKQDEVPPGGIGRFEFNLQAPDVAGLYTEYFTPVIEGQTWLPDQKMHFTSYVYENDYEGLMTQIVGDKQVANNSDTEVKFTLQNVGGRSWLATGNASLDIEVMKGQGVNMTQLSYPKKTINPGESVEITVVLRGTDKVRNGTLRIVPKVGSQILIKRPATFFYRAVSKKSSSSSNINTTINRTIDTTKQNFTGSAALTDSAQNIRVKLSFTEQPIISSTKGMSLYSLGKNVKTFAAGEEAKVLYTGASYRVESSTRAKLTSDPPRFVANNGGALEVANWERRPSWNLSLNDNLFLGTLEFRRDSVGNVLINELPLEDYLKGLAENTESEHIEKIKALIVAARTYAKYYMTVDEKFPGKQWNLDDDPNVSQKYLGYGYQMRAPKVSSAVDATKGEVITYKGELIKTPYFTQSAGRTFSAKEVWGWTTTPYLQSVPDTYCDATEIKGHGVGLSACGARGLAAAGKTYKEILKYFYIGVEVGE